MTQDFTLFVDESGNAGANLLDAHPFFTLVGVAARDQDVPALDARLATVFAASDPNPATELKGSQAINQDRLTYVEDVAAITFNAGQPILWSVIERRFMIAAIIVDNFFDHVYNDAVGPEWTYPSEARQGLANHLYRNLSDATLRLAATALVHGDATGIRQLLVATQHDLAAAPPFAHIDAKAALQGVAPHIEELADALATVHARQPSDPLQSHTGTLRSPNLTAFFEMVNRAEDHYRTIPHARVKILFDSSGQFDEAFAYLRELLANARDSELRFPDRPPIIFGHRAVAEFQVGDSKAHPLIRAADLFAAGIRQVFELFASQAQPQAIGRALQFFLGFVALNLDAPLFNYVVSDSLVHSMWPTIERYAP